MTDLRQAAQQALEALESKYIVNCGAWRVQQDQAITAIKEALAQPVQEQKYEKRIAPYSTTLSMLLNTAPPQQQAEQVDCPRCGHVCSQRPWVGLTPDEVKHLYPYGRSVWGKETFEAIEKALKEKNSAN